jgi:hypothetical protein
MTEALRQEIRVRDDYRCQYCGVSETDTGSELTIDHIRPKHKGGDDSPENLVPATNSSPAIGERSRNDSFSILLLTLSPSIIKSKTMVH